MVPEAAGRRSNFLAIGWANNGSLKISKRLSTMASKQPDREITTLLQHATCLYTSEQIENAIATMALQISHDLQHTNPILLPIMNGGLSIAASLMKHLQFPLQVDYLHITRYRGDTSGGTTDWIYRPRIDITDRVVILIDDLLDHGITLLEAVDYCKGAGAEAVYTCVLILKELQSRPGLQSVDYFALTSPDKYIFGYGMDYKTYWRNAPGIFAV